MGTLLQNGVTIGSVIRHITTLARTSGRTTLNESWFGFWQPGNNNEKLRVQWLRHILLGDPEITLPAINAAARHNDFAGRVMPEWYFGPNLARSIHWQIALMFLLAGVPKSPAEVRAYSSERMLRTAELCLNGQSYDQALANTAGIR